MSPLGNLIRAKGLVPNARDKFSDFAQDMVANTGLAQMGLTDRCMKCVSHGTPKSHRHEDKKNGRKLQSSIVCLRSKSNANPSAASQIPIHAVHTSILMMPVLGITYAPLP